MLLPQAHQVMVMECVPFPGKGGFVAVQAQIKKKVIQGSLFVDVAQISGNGVTTIVRHTPEWAGRGSTSWIPTSSITMTDSPPLIPSSGGYFFYVLDIFFSKRPTTFQTNNLHGSFV
jgi:hypothetical protein